MAISPFSFFVVGILLLSLYSFIRDRKKNVYYLVTVLLIFELLITRGYFIDLGIGRQLYYNEFVLLFLSPLFLLLTLGKGYDIKTVFYACGYFFSVLFGIILLYFIKPDFPVIPIGTLIDSFYYGRVELQYVEVNINHMLRLIRVVLYFPILLFFGSGYLDYEKVYEIVINIAKIMCLILLIEMVIKIIGLGSLYNEFLNMIFDDGKNINFTRAGLITLSGLTREPGHLSHCLFVALFILAMKKVDKIFLFYLIIVFLIISMSFANFALAVISIILFFIYRNLTLRSVVFKSILLTLVIAAITTILLLIIPEETFSHNYQRLMSFLTGEYVGSEGIRIWSISENISYFFKRPLFGLGLGSTISNGFIPSLLANIGIIGVYFWFMMHKQTLKVKLEMRPLLALIVVLFFVGDIGWVYSPKITLAFIAIASNYKTYKSEPDSGKDFASLSSYERAL